MNKNGKYRNYRSKSRKCVIVTNENQISMLAYFNILYTDEITCIITPHTHIKMKRLKMT